MMSNCIDYAPMLNDNSGYMAHNLSQDTLMGHNL